MGNRSGSHWWASEVATDLGHRCRPQKGFSEVAYRGGSLKEVLVTDIGHRRDYRGGLRRLEIDLSQ